MNEDKMFGLQMQVRQNHQEMFDYMNELKAWEDEIKIKDEQLKGQPLSKEERLPPVRNSHLRKKKEAKREKKKEDSTQEKESNKPLRINSYDYRAWDKFDVEKACDDVDNEKVSSTESEPDEELEEQHCKQQAEQLKEQGNLHFKNGKYSDAIDCYTRGIALDNQSALLFANRAMALLKQEQHAAAELDCTDAIMRDPSYTKAFSRRAAARFTLKKYEDAMADYKQVLKLEPNNKFAKNELERIEKTVNPASVSFDRDQISDTGIVKPIYKKPEDRSKVPLRRIPIEEIGVEEDKSTASFRKKAEEESLRVDRPDLFSIRGDTRDSKIPKVSDLQQVTTSEAFHQSKNNGSVSDTLSVSQMTGRGDEYQKMDASKPSCSYVSIKSGLPVPTSSFQFQADWKILKNARESFYHYFKQIEPKAYRQIFGEALDAEILSAIIDVLKSFYVPDQCDVRSVLEQIATVKRFGMTIMFLSEKDKQALREVFQSLSSSSLCEPSIASLERLYAL